MTTLATLGLSLVLIAWIELIIRVLVRKHLSFSPFFLGVYVVGAGVLAADGFYSYNAASGGLNCAIALAAFIVLVALIYKRGKPGTF
jgi:hypothetical protein